MPVNIIPAGQELLCKWMFTGNTRFSDPFVSDTLLRCKQLPENKHRMDCVSSLQLLKDWVEENSSIPLTAFIFHVSRCGSTTLTQLLDLDPANRVLSEVPFLDELLRIPFTYPEHAALPVEEYFRAAMAWYGQPHDENEKRLYIKTDSWHLHFYHRLRKMYPDAAFIIIIRTPDEVLQSQRRQRGIQAVPGMLEPAMFGFDTNAISFDLDRHMEKVLESYFEQILIICKEDPDVTIVDYRDGMEEMLYKTLQLTNAAMPEGFEKAVKERLQFDGKNPGFFFSPGDTGKKTDTGARCRELYTKCQWLRSGTLTDDKTSQHR